MRSLITVHQILGKFFQLLRRIRRLSPMTLQLFLVNMWITGR
jgi:hypothetical protein